MSTLREAISLATEMFGADHPRTANGQVALARALALRAETDESETLLRTSLATYEASLGESSTRAGGARLELGKLLLRSGRAEQAEAELLAAWRIITARPGAEHPHSRQTATALTALYEQQGNVTDAELWRGR